MSTTLHIGRICAAAAIMSVAGVAAAAEDNTVLPGVSGNHAIVKPVPEPEDLPANEDGSITIGNTRVRLSGSVTVDIGVGNLGRPR
jgi:hypothetical protein